MNGMAGKLWGLLPFGNKDLSCVKLRQMSSDFLEGTLGPKDMWRFSYHTERCKGCGTFVSSLRATIQTLNSLPSQNAPEDLKQRLMKQFSEDSKDTTHNAGS